MIAVAPQSQATIILGDASAATIPVNNPPPWLGQLAPGSVLQGTVQSVDPNGNVTIQTANGPLSLAGPATLPPGASVTLELQPTAQPQVSITALLPPPPPATYDGTVSTSLPPAVATTQLPSPGDIVTAQVERGAPSATSSLPPDVFTVISDVFPVVTSLGPGVAVPASGPQPLPLAVGLAEAGVAAGPRPVAPLVPATLLVQELADARTILAEIAGSAPGAQAQPQAGSATANNAALLLAAELEASATPAGTTAASITPPATGNAVPLTASAAQAAAGTAAETETASARAAAASSLEPPSLAPETSAVPRALITATAGQRVTVQIISITPVATPTATGPVTGAPLPTTASPSAAPQTVTGEILQAADPTAAGARINTALTVAAGQTVTGTVVGANAAGQPILSAGPVLLTLATAAPPPGTEITIAWAVGEATQRPVAVAQSTEVAATAELLTAAQGTAAQSAVAAVVPTPGPLLGAQMAYFVNAIQAGDVKAWLGDGPRSILDRTARGKAALQSMTKEFGKAEEAATTTTPGGWKGLTIPILNGGIVEPVRLYLHGTNPDEGGDGDGTKSNEEQRFLIDIELTQLGRFQIDGFVRSDRLDLMIRTPAALDQELKIGIEQIFVNATSARGLAGLVVFQVAPPIVPDNPGGVGRTSGILV